MFKYLLPLILLTSCSSGFREPEPTAEEKIAYHISHTKEFQEALDTRIHIWVNDKFRQNHDTLVKQRTDCKHTAECLNHRTYLSINEFGGYNCLLVENDRQVSCND